PQDQQIVVSVSDTGIGIQPEDMEKLFRLNNYTTHGTANEKGTGLGLVIAHRQISLQADLSPHQNRILGGSLISWSDFIQEAFDFTVFLYLPPDIQLARLRQREKKHY
ncbi:MAG: ATP-binding protein, partial [Bacteroidota bacterium]